LLLYSKEKVLVCGYCEGALRAGDLLGARTSGAAEAAWGGRAGPHQPGLVPLPLWGSRAG